MEQMFSSYQMMEAQKCKGFSYYSNQNLITPVYQLSFKTRGTKELLSQHVLVIAKRNG
jgi:hypothetical protein